MSPVAEQFHIEREQPIREIRAPRPAYGAEHAPRSFSITRCLPEDLPEPDLFNTEDAVYFLSHEPTTPLDHDLVDGIATLASNKDGEATLTIEFASRTDLVQQRLFKNAAAQDVGDNFPNVCHLMVREANQENSILQRMDNLQQAA